ncbi:MAG: dodecin domain-containing protein [Desulfobacterales bacterium]|nr:dodecin domain-containing protein [Desulfobacterales bacterium]
MGESVYKLIDLVGSSSNSWEEAAKNAVEKAGKSIRDIRIAEVLKFDIKIQDGQPLQYRTNIRLSFKFED